MSCPNHDADACCTKCTTLTDGRGFPHPSVAHGRMPLQQCLHCTGWRAPWQWVSDADNAVFCCAACAPGSYERIAKHLEAFLSTANNEARKKKLLANIERVRRLARKA